MTLGERIKQLREERKLTQDELGHRSGVGQSHLSHIEMGKSSPHMCTLELLAKGLGMVFVADFVEILPETKKDEDAFWIGRAQQKVRP